MPQVQNPIEAKILMHKMQLAGQKSNKWNAVEHPHSCSKGFLNQNIEHKIAMQRTAIPYKWSSWYNSKHKVCFQKI